MKRILFFTGIFTFLAVGIACAQTYQTVQTLITNVGNPPVVNGSDRSKIAEVIVQHLTRGSDGYFNKINPNPYHYPGGSSTYPGISYIVSERGPNPPGDEDSADAGYIFCTSLVVDVFNISGIKLPRSLINVDRNDVPYWKSTKGFHYIDYYSAQLSKSKAQEQAVLSQVRPGDAIFFTGWCGRGRWCHTGVVYAVNIKPSGDGYIETREANTPVPREKLVVSSWNMVNDYASFGGMN